MADAYNEHGYDVQKGKRNYTWQDVWTLMLTKPGPQTVLAILRDPEARATRARNWVFLTGTFAGAATLVSQQIIGAYPFGLLNALILGFVIGGISAMLSMYVGAGLLQNIARRMGGQGSYNDFFYAYGAYTAPLSVISLATVPFATTGSTAVALATLALNLYSFALLLITLKAVNDFKWGQTITSVVLWIIAVFAIAFVLGFVLAPFLLF